ncbi:response regulator [Methylobacterium sp. A54F]
MRQENRFVTDALDGSASLVARGVARALENSYDTSAVLPERLRDLALILLERDAPARKGLPGATDRPGQPTRLVLVVEDDPEIRDLAVALLEETVLDVVACDSGEAAIDLLRQHGPDVAMLFTDVHLSGAVDGIGLANSVNCLWPEIRLVVTSGEAAHRTRELPGAAVYLDKPWRALDVLVQVDRAVRRPADGL